MDLLFWKNVGLHSALVLQHGDFAPVAWWALLKPLFCSTLVAFCSAAVKERRIWEKRWRDGDLP